MFMNTHILAPSVALLMEHNVNLHLDISVLQQIVFNRESLEIMAYV